MEGFFNAVRAVVLILLLTATGYFCAHAGWLTEEGKRFLNKFVITVAMPCTCVYGFTANLSRDMISQAYVLILIALVCIALSYALAILVAKLLRMPRKRFGVFVMMCAVSNSIFIGYAMCKELFGDVCTPYVMEFYMVNTVYTQVVGLAFVRWSGEAVPEDGAQDTPLAAHHRHRPRLFSRAVRAASAGSGQLLLPVHESDRLAAGAAPHGAHHL